MADADPKGILGAWPPLSSRTGSGRVVVLDAGAHDTGEHTIGYSSYVLQQISDGGDRSGDVRVRGYINEDYATDDVDRAVGVDPEGDHGVMFDVVLDGTEDEPWTLNLAPTAVCSPWATGTWVTISNLSSDDDVTYNITFAYLPLEGNLLL